MTTSTRGQRGRPPGGGAGQLLANIRKGKAHTKAELGAATGLARATVSKQMTLLVKSRLVLLQGSRVSAGAGRPAAHYVFNPAAGTILAADLGVTGAHLAVTDLAGSPLAQTDEVCDITQGPEKVLGWVVGRFDELLVEAGKSRADVRGLGVGVPGPVNFVTGQPLAPPLMPGWDGFSIPGFVTRAFPGLPVLVDRSVNLMALAEADALDGREANLVFVKAATGIGCGLIMDGRLHRGADGAAGDIAHVTVSDAGDVLCGCGQYGCLEATAGGAAVARALAGMGVKVNGSRDVVRLLRAGKPEAVRLVRQSGRALGQALAMLVSILNPGLIVMGGDLAEAGDHLATGVREVVLARAQPLVTRHLRIVGSRLGNQGGIRGAALMAIDRVLAPGAVDQQLVSVRPRGSSARDGRSHRGLRTG